VATKQKPVLSPATTAAAVQALAPLELRLTGRRRSVLAVLEHSSRPLTVEEVVTGSGVPTSTVYRILAELVSAGVVVRVTGIGSGDRYELAEQLSQHHHHHLVCIDCGAIADFDPSPQLEKLIDREIEALLETSGFEITHHVFDVRGRCRSCIS